MPSHAFDRLCTGCLPSAYARKFLCVFAAAVGLTALFTPFASAEEICGSAVTHRYGETRSAFGSVLAGCDKAGACYVSASQVDKTLPANFRYQLRILQPAGGGKLGLKLTAVEPMADPMTAMQLSWGKTKVDLTGSYETRGNVVNDYFVKDADLADKTARAIAAKAKVVTWLFWSQHHDEVNAEIPVTGAAKALDWIACMAKPH